MSLLLAGILALPWPVLPFRDRLFNIAMLLIALMVMALVVFWLAEVVRAAVWRVRRQAAEDLSAPSGDASGDEMRIDEPDTELRRRFFHRVRLLPRSLSEGRMNDPHWRS